MTKRENREAELAQSEDLDVLWGALHSALEADLSGFGWPDNSLALLESASNEVENLMTMVDNLNG